MRRTKGGGSRYEKTAVLDQSGLLCRRSGLLLFLSGKRMGFPGHRPVWIVRLILPSFHPYPAGRDFFLFRRFHVVVLPFVRASFCQTRSGPVRSYALFVRTVLETGRACFLLDGETESGQSLNVQVWCSSDMVPNRYQQFSGIIALSEITSTDRFDSESYYRSRGVYLQGDLLSGSFYDPSRFSVTTLARSP